jgi:hypothetical protein
MYHYHLLLSQHTNNIDGSSPPPRRLFSVAIIAAPSWQFLQVLSTWTRVQHSSTHKTCAVPSTTNRSSAYRIYEVPTREQIQVLADALLHAAGLFHVARLCHHHLHVSQCASPWTDENCAHTLWFIVPINQPANESYPRKQRCVPYWKLNCSHPTYKEVLCSYDTRLIIVFRKPQLFDPMMSQLSPLNTELNPICPLLALFGAHHILHVSR